MLICVFEPISWKKPKVNKERSVQKNEEVNYNNKTILGNQRILHCSSIPKQLFFLKHTYYLFNLQSKDARETK